MIIYNILFNINTPVHTVLIHLPTLCYGSRKQSVLAGCLWLVNLSNRLSAVS